MFEPRTLMALSLFMLVANLAGAAVVICLIATYG